MTPNDTTIEIRWAFFLFSIERKRKALPQFLLDKERKKKASACPIFFYENWAKKTIQLKRAFTHPTTLVPAEQLFLYLYNNISENFLLSNIRIFNVFRKQQWWWCELSVFLMCSRSTMVMWIGEIYFFNRLYAKPKGQAPRRIWAHVVTATKKMKLIQFH